MSLFPRVDKRSKLLPRAIWQRHERAAKIHISAKALFGEIKFTVKRPFFTDLNRRGTFCVLQECYLSFEWSIRMALIANKCAAAMAVIASHNHFSPSLL